MCTTKIKANAAHLNQMEGTNSRKWAKENRSVPGSAGIGKYRWVSPFPNDAAHVRNRPC